MPCGGEFVGKHLTDFTVHGVELFNKGCYQKLGLDEGNGRVQQVSPSVEIMNYVFATEGVQRWRLSVTMDLN